MGQDDVYAFVMKGDVAQHAANAELRKVDESPQDVVDRIRGAFPFDLLDHAYIEMPKRWQSSIRSLPLSKTLPENSSKIAFSKNTAANWWDTQVPQSIREQAEQRKADEAQHRYHGSRGTSMIFCVQMGDLVSIIQKNEKAFEDYIPSVEWARQLFRTVERSRNVIMHSGELSMNDVQRVGMNIRDWLQQVGG